MNDKILMKGLFMTTEIEGNYYLELAKDQTSTIWNSGNASLKQVKRLRDFFQEAIASKDGFIEFDDFNGINTTIHVMILKSCFIFIKKV